jgi:hypothetical protein
MSIYRQRGWDGVSDIHQTPAPGEAGAPEDAPSGDSSAGSHDWSKDRKARPVEYLLRLGEKWMDALPPDLFPGALATQYPRIVNFIAVQWNDRRMCPAYFEELLVDRRGGRQGFPSAVNRDLQRLRDYWQSVWS